MRHSKGHRLGLSRADRARRSQLEERHVDRELARSYGDDIDERAAEAEEIGLQSIRRREGSWDALGYAWSAVTSGSSWQQDANRFGGLLGWARAVEVTYSEAHGWHVHIHVLLCFREQVSAELVAASVGARMFGRWRRALERRGFSASEEHGWDLRRAQLGDGDLADYFTKMAHEVTSGHRKESRRGGRSPFQLLADAASTYCVEDMERWWEWETASDGRRQLTWSGRYRDLRALAGLGRESTDEEIAAEDQEADVHLGLGGESWDYIRTQGCETELLNIAEQDGLDASRRWLAKRGLLWTETRSARRPPTEATQPYGWQDDARSVLSLRA